MESYQVNFDILQQRLLAGGQMQLPSSYHANVQRVSGDEEEVESLFDEDREDREITANLIYVQQMKELHEHLENQPNTQSHKRNFHLVWSVTTNRFY